MKNETTENFSKYEVARIIGARALQIAMDAPILLKISEEKLKEINFDALVISEMELEEGALPITVHRPIPRRGKTKNLVVKEDSVSDEEIKAKEQEVEKEIAEDAEELGFSNPEDSDDLEEDSDSDDN